MRLSLCAALAAAAVAGFSIGCGSKAPAPATTATPDSSPAATTGTPPGPTTSATSPSPAPSPTNTAATLGTTPTPGKSKLKIEIAKSKVTVNGKAIPIPGDLSDFEKAFGKPSGIAQDPLSETNKYVFWRDLGIRCSQTTKGKQNVQEVVFSFDPLWDMGAKALCKPFSEDLFVEGQPITRTTKFDDVKKIKPGELSSGSWNISYSDPDLRVIITPDEKGMNNVEVEQPPFAR